MNYFLFLSILSPLSGLEKLTLCAILVITTILLLDLVRRNVKKNRDSKMLKNYLFVKNNKWNDVVDLLTSPNNIGASDIHNKLQIDISKFDSRHRELLYYELTKVNQNENVNSLNLKMFVNTLYNKIPNQE